MKRQLIVSGFLTILCCLFAGCSTVPMKVDSVSNPYMKLSEYKRFSFASSPAVDQQKEQRLQGIVKKEMEEKGFVFDDKAPQFLVDITASEDSNLVQKEKIEQEFRVLLVFSDLIYRKQTIDPKLVWQGEAHSSSAGRDVSALDVEKCLVIGLIQSYPGTLKAVTKEVSSSSCKK